MIHVRGARKELARQTDFTQESQQLEAAVVDLQLRSAGETAHAIGEVVKQIEEVLGHGESRGGEGTPVSMQEDV